MVDVSLALPGSEVTVKPVTVSRAVGLNRSPSSIPSGIRPSTHVGFPVGDEVDGEDTVERLPGGVELVQDKAPAVWAQNFVVEVNHNLVSRGVHRDLLILFRIRNLLATFISSLNVTAMLSVPPI